MIQEINHIGVKSYDMDASLHLYVDLLGGEIIRNAGSLDGKFRYVYVQLGAGVIELITSLDKSDQGIAHVAFLLRDKSLDDHYASITAKGYAFTLNPKDSSSGDGRLAFFNDPAGVSFELIERTEDIRKPFAGQAITVFDHTVIETGADLEACAAFYTGELGLHGSARDSRFVLGSDSLALRAGSAPKIAHMAMRAMNPNGLREALAAAGIATEDAGPDAGAYWIVSPSTERILIL
ncbi:VOC family protein [Eubacteriales bacterium OttesenSCG-928-A19]|nr:VOC family protein [Eubacteriales bacterium OttesenSCG-928-A19]